MWTWGSWCSRCVICPRLAGSPSPWSKQEISKPWTSPELQVGSANAAERCQERNNLALIPGWSCHIFIGRSIREGVPDVWRPEAEEEKDLDKAEHSEPRLQWGHRVWRSSREHWSDQPAHRCHGLRSVSASIFEVGFLRSIFTHVLVSVRCHFWTSGLDTMK